jgi:hypothetical protein
MNQEQIKEEKSSILTLVLSSILLHMLLLLAVIFYKLAPEAFPERKTLSPDDRVTLWTSPTQKIMQPQQPIAKQVPKQAPKQIDEKPKEEEKTEPDFNFLKKAPIITPGKQGIDEQYTQGDNIPIQTTNEKIKEEEKTEPIKNISAQKAAKKVMEQEAHSKNEATLENTLSSENKFSKTSTTFTEATKQPIKFDTNLKMFPKAKSAQHQNVPQVTQKSSTKSISFKDISLGFNNAATNIGNSQHLMIQGTSPDIPQGEELKYITFINQMANMIVSSMHSSPEIRLLPHDSHEKIVCFMKVARSGELLGTKIIIPSKHEIINLFIIKSIKNVGLFNPIPKFIAKDTFEINWHILT